MKEKTLIITTEHVHKWRKAGLTIEKLSVLLAAGTPLTEAKLAIAADVSVRMIQRFTEDDNDLLKVVSTKKSGAISKAALPKRRSLELLKRHG
jgi:hypothetical protein